MRDRLIEILNEAHQEYYSRLDFTKTYIEALADHLIANGVAVQRWIPVTERLPEDGELVLVMANGKPAKEITLVQAYELGWCRSDRDGKWFLEGWPAWSGAEVTHWMPIPEPQKEEQ